MLFILPTLKTPPRRSLIFAKSRGRRGKENVADDNSLEVYLLERGAAATKATSNKQISEKMRKGRGEKQ